MQHIHISARHRLFDLRFHELWRYRDLIWLFTRRALRVGYMQTVLGPLWLFINPLLTSLTYVVLFGNIAKISTDGVPQFLFYLSGHAIWSFFASCVKRSAGTFSDNAYLFGKVYFPRLVMPLSYVLCNLILYGVQMLLVLALLFWYALRGAVHPLWSAWLCLPLLLVQLGVMGLGVGVIISSLTTKYRDLSVLVEFGMTLWMYATPVVYPLSAADPALRHILLLNPVTAPVELYRHILLGVGGVSLTPLVCSWVFTLLVALAGVLIFSHVERTFMDTV